MSIQFLKYHANDVYCPAVPSLVRPTAGGPVAAGWVGTTMTKTARTNAALVRSFLTDVIAGRDTAAVGAFLSDDVIDRNLVFEAAPGQAGVTALGWQVLAGADIELEISDVVATHDRVAVRATVSGTHQESLMDLAPTGRSFDIAYAWFCRIENGRITEIRSLPDGLGLMQQVGAIPDGSRRMSLSQPTEHNQP